MTKYLLKRLLTGVLSACAATIIVMIMIFSLLDRNLVFAKDSVYSHQTNNAREAYKYRKWREYGYLDYVTYADYVNSLVRNGEVGEETAKTAVKLGRTAEKDSEEAQAYIKKFTEYYEGKGYKVVRLDAVLKPSGRGLAEGGSPQLFAHRDIPLISRVLKYFGSIFTIDNIHKASGVADADRGLTFTFYDPVYNPVGSEKKVFSPAIMGNGTTHKYLLYFNNKFPYVHQNLLTISLGTSFAVNQGVDVFTTMTKSQGSFVKKPITFPTGFVEESADDLHTATYVAGSKNSSPVTAARFTDDYTNVQTVNKTYSKVGFSFILGILSSLLAYLIGIPAGISMARKKDKLGDKIGTIYIVFSLAVPSLAYIFMVKALGRLIGMPTTFDLDKGTWLMYVLPIISLALPSIGNLMKWLRRYMIDQMNSDYVKFARSGGLSESEIFSKHIFKNAAIPIIHGIPGTVLFALVGAIITERVYVVPGAGGLLTTAISMYDNNVIVGLTLFYALLSVVAIILGDLLMTLVDPRISFVQKAR